MKVIFCCFLLLRQIAPSENCSWWCYVQTVKSQSLSTVHKRHAPNPSHLSCKSGVDSMSVTNYHAGEGEEYTNCVYSLSLILWSPDVLLTSYRNISICAIISLVKVTIFSALMLEKDAVQDNRPFCYRIVLNSTMRLKSCLAENMGFKISICAWGHAKAQILLWCLYFKKEIQLQEGMGKSTARSAVLLGGFNNASSEIIVATNVLISSTWKISIQPQNNII